MDKLIFLGDVWLPYPYFSKIVMDAPFIFNMESPICIKGEQTYDKICLKAKYNFIQETFRAKPLAVCLGNNHIMDYGIAGLSSTIEHLNKSGIKHFGCGTLSDNCNNPLMIELGGVAIAFLAYVCKSSNPIFATEELPGVAQLEINKVKDDILLAKNKRAEKIIVQCHWGEEFLSLPPSENVKNARAIIDAGASLLIGHHPHCIQGFEEYNGKHIFYSLGNAIFPDVKSTIIRQKEKGVAMSSFEWKWPRRNRKSLLVEYYYNKEKIEIKEIAYNKKEIYYENKKNKYCAINYGSSNYDQIYIKTRKKDLLINAIKQVITQRRMPYKNTIKKTIKTIFQKLYFIF